LFNFGIGYLSNLQTVSRLASLIEKGKGKYHFYFASIPFRLLLYAAASYFTSPGMLNRFAVTDKD